MNIPPPLDIYLKPSRIGAYTACITLDGENSGVIITDAYGHFLNPTPSEIHLTAEYQRLHAVWRRLQTLQRHWRLRLDHLLGKSQTFSPTQIAQATLHPVLADLIHQLVWTDAQGHEGLLRGNLLDNPRGSTPYSGPLRLVHPFEWLEAGTLVKWQHYARAHHLRQPIQQIFRPILLPDNPNNPKGNHQEDSAGTLDSAHVINKMRRQHWQGPQAEQGGISFTRNFSHSWAAHLTFNFAVGQFKTTLLLTPPKISFSRAGNSVISKLAPAIVYSEVFFDLHRLTTGNLPDTHSHSLSADTEAIKHDES